MSTVLAALVLRASAFAGGSHAPIGPDAVWHPPEGFLVAMHQACDGASGAAFGNCFVAQMEKAGASPAALAFARRTGHEAYAAAFRKAGVVDVVFATYPFRANENSACFLVNGDPAMLDVDDPTKIDRAALASNRAYAGLLKSYPHLAIFPGPRTGELAVISTHLKGGGQHFQVDYTLVDGCRACTRVGSLRMAFDFAVNGRFVGTRLLAVRPLRH
jgi:hypothetical protein